MSSTNKPMAQIFCCKDINPVDAWNMLEGERDSYLIDVRTHIEVAYVGFVNLNSLSKEVVYVPWRNFPNMEVNENFVKQLEELLPDLNKKSKLLFICKIGGRSFDAANEMFNSGYENCYNILGGFEGTIDANGQRGNIDGWKKDNLPWEQR